MKSIVLSPDTISEIAELTNQPQEELFIQALADEERGHQTVFHFANEKKGSRYLIKNGPKPAEDDIVVEVAITRENVEKIHKESGKDMALLASLVQLGELRGEAQVIRYVIKKEQQD